MTATTEPQVAAGSKIEAAGAFFTFAAATDINGTAWTAITSAATAYVTLTPSGMAGSQIMSASWTETAPVWSTSKHGWYTTAASNIRVVAGCTKTDETTWTDKFILANVQDYRVGDFRIMGSASVETAVITLAQITTAQITTASVQSTLTVASAATVLGPLTATGQLVLTELYYFFGNSTENQIYDSIKAYLPTIGDIRHITGGCESTTNVVAYIFYAAHRTDAGTIRIYAIRINITSSSVYSIATLDMDDEGASEYGNVRIFM